MESVKSLGKYYVKYTLVAALVLSISLFYGFVAVVTNFIRRLREGPSFFEVKERTLPPTCLQDSAWGRHAYINLKNIKLHYVENGDRSKPLMVFVHGFPEFWFSWRHQLKHFASTHWVVAVDLRGYGDSDKPSRVADYDVPLLMSDIVELVGALKRDKCTLVAHDWGGVISWNLAAYYPDIVEKLVILNSPHPASFTKKIKSSLGQFLKSWYIFLFQLPYIPEWNLSTRDLDIFNRCFTDENKKLTITQEELEGYKYTFARKGSWTPPVNYYRQNFKVSQLVAGERSMPRIKAPTLIVWGENDIALSKDLPELARRYCDNLTVKYVPQGNHFVQQHKPAEVNKLIADFV